MAKAKLPTKMVVDYRQATNHRAVYADGAVGGPIPQQPNMLRVALYRESIPFQQEALKLTPSGDNTFTASPVQHSEFSGELAIVREIDATLVLTSKVARELSVWLGNQVEEMEKATKS